MRDGIIGPRDTIGSRGRLAAEECGRVIRSILPGAAILLWLSSVPDEYVQWPFGGSGPIEKRPPIRFWRASSLCGVTMRDASH
jgi:hypothetical protein